MCIYAYGKDTERESGRGALPISLNICICTETEGERGRQIRQPPAAWLAGLVGWLADWLSCWALNQGRSGEE